MFHVGADAKLAAFTQESCVYGGVSLAKLMRRFVAGTLFVVVLGADFIATINGSVIVRFEPSNRDADVASPSTA